jgi:6-methylsalicylate decarboxylase
MIDVHQHLWPPTLFDALRARRQPPCLTGETLTLLGEPDYRVDPHAHDPDLRAVQAVDDGLGLALVSLSSPLGIEHLPASQALELITAYHEGALALPAPFGAWAAACLTEIDPPALERELDCGFVGLQLPATALLDEPGYRRAAPLLEVLSRRGAPLFIHPGPVSPGAGPVPSWWAPVVTYTAQMHAAWFAFSEFGRPHHPALRVLFAMLAGLAPLHGERFAARTGRRSVLDGQAFLDVSSYGTRAIDAVMRVTGVDVLVNGSDRPYAEPVQLQLGPSVLSALRTTNPTRLLDLKEVSDGRALAPRAQPRTR